jgi:hypothetical protein
MSINSRVIACRDALIVAMRAGERAGDSRSVALVRACLDVVEYLAHQPTTTTIDSIDTALNVLQRADVEFETDPPRTPAIRAAVRKAFDRLQPTGDERRAAVDCADSMRVSA